MWSYYGSKTNVVGVYPKPLHDTIIEPFAGAAKYSLLYFDRNVILYDKYDVIVKIWHFLQQASPGDILGLPRLNHGERISDLNLSEPERLLMGFIIAKGSQSPRDLASERATVMRPNTINFHLKNIAKQLYKIKHWSILGGGYDEIPNQDATWFIDPPYQHGGHVYVESNKNIDFNHLRSWCQDRKGQVMVCETMKADWLPFVPLATQKGSVKWQREAIWTNYHTHFNNLQQQLF